MNIWFVLYKSNWEWSCLLSSDSSVYPNFHKCCCFLTRTDLSALFPFHRWENSLLRRLSNWPKLAHKRQWWSQNKPGSPGPQPRASPAQCPCLGLSLAGQWEGPRAAGYIRLKPKGLPLASGSGRECTVAVTYLLEYNAVTRNIIFKML